MDEPDATGTPAPADSTAVPAPGPTAEPTATPEPTATVTVTPTPEPSPSGATLQDVSDRLDHLGTQADGISATLLVVGIFVALAAGVIVVKAMR